MKIIINLLNFTSSNIAGVGYFMKRIFKLLDDQNTEGIKFCILHSPNIDIQKVFSINKKINAEYKPIKYIPNFILRVLYEQLILPFRLTGYDVFYSPTPAVPVLFRNNKIKIISTIHDLIPFFVKEKYSLLRKLYICWITKKSAQISDKIITVSDNSLYDIVKTLGVQKEKINIVYNFIPNQEIVKDNISKNYFITICTIEPGKNLSNLLKAFKIFKEKYEMKDFKLYIVGKNGWGYRQIYNIYDELELQNDVIFTGYLSEEEKNKLLQESMVMLYMSTYEGFGTPLLEAMYWNKPSVVSNVSSLPEVVGEAGIKCDPNNIEEIADSMYRVIIEKDKLCSNIPNQLKKFDPQEQLEKFLKIIRT